MGTQRKDKTLRKHRNKTEGKRRGTVWVGYFVTFAGARNEETWSTQKREALIQRGNIEHMQGRHSITDKTQTERTGDYKDRLTRELRRHTWDQIKQSDWGETGSQGAHGEQKHNKTVQGRDNNRAIRFCSWRAITHSV